MVISNASIESICNKLGINYMVLLCKQFSPPGKMFIGNNNKEVVLNKNSGIYTKLNYTEYIQSDAGQRFINDLAASLEGKRILLSNIPGIHFKE